MEELQLLDVGRKGAHYVSLRDRPFDKLKVNSREVERDGDIQQAALRLRSGQAAAGGKQGDVPQ